MLPFQHHVDEKKDLDDRQFEGLRLSGPVCGSQIIFALVIPVWILAEVAGVLSISSLFCSKSLLQILMG